MSKRIFTPLVSQDITYRYVRKSSIKGTLKSHISSSFIWPMHTEASTSLTEYIPGRNKKNSNNAEEATFSSRGRMLSLGGG